MSHIFKKYILAVAIVCPQKRLPIPSPISINSFYVGKQNRQISPSAYLSRSTLEARLELQFHNEG